ncbi:hypothetical protein G9A89_018592 [Geosiphon pyriformis]|nr:hypothetical protein G9A89_018592 [Geosiphon pyriformis]
MGDYSYLPQQSEEHFKAYNKNNLDSIELNPLPFCLICFLIEEQSSRQFQDFWNWFLNEHLAETYTAYTTYYFDQAYFEDNFEERNNKTLLKTEEESYQTTSVFNLFSSKLEHSTQIVTPEPMAQDPLQQNILIALQELSQQTNMIMNTSSKLLMAIFKALLLLGSHKKPIPMLNKESLDGHQQMLKKTTLHLLLEKQKIHSFTKGLKTDLSYAFWPLLRIEDNQRIHLGSTLPVFAPAPQMAVTSFAAQTQDPNEQLINRLTANFVQLLELLAQAVRDNQQPQRLRFELHFNQLQQPPYQRQQNHGPPVCYYCGLTGHFSKDCNNLLLPPPAPRNNDIQNNRPNNNNGESTSQSEENPFYAFNLTDNDHNIDKLVINLSESTRKKKKAKVDFVLNPNKASKSSANNNKPPKAKVFKNLSKLKSPEIIQKFRPYFVKNLMETPAHIIFGQLMTHLQFRKNLCKSLIPKKKTPKTNKCFCQAELADNSNVTPLICKAQMAGYFIDLILDSGLSVSVIAKHFLEAIGRKINEPFTRSMTNIYGDKKKDLDIAKAIPIRINNISIETDMELKKAKTLLDYELCKLTIRCDKKSIVVKCQHWTTPPVPKQNQEEEQSNESNDNESDDKDQKEQEETAELVYTIFTSNSKPLDNIKANKKGIMINGKLICWPYYDILRRIFDRKPDKKAKYKPISLIPREELKEIQKFFENKPPKIQSLVIEQREPSLKEKKVNIENLLVRNSPVILKEDDILG